MLTIARRCHHPWTSSTLHPVFPESVLVRRQHHRILVGEGNQSDPIAVGSIGHSMLPVGSLGGHRALSGVARRGRIAITTVWSHRDMRRPVSWSRRRWSSFSSAGHHTADGHDGRDDGGGNADGDENRHQTHSTRLLAPGAQQVLVDALGKGVRLPATSCLALHCVNTCHPVATVATVLDYRVKTVALVPWCSQVSVGDPRHLRAELKGCTGWKSTHPGACVTSSSAGQAWQDGVSVPDVASVLQDCPMQGSIGGDHPLNSSITGTSHLLWSATHHPLKRLHVVVPADAEWGLLWGPSARGRTSIDVLAKEPEEGVALVAVVPCDGPHLEGLGKVARHREDVGLLSTGVTLGQVVAVVDQGGRRAVAMGCESGVLLHTLARLQKQKYNIPKQLSWSKDRNWLNLSVPFPLPAHSGCSKHWNNQGTRLEGKLIPKSTNRENWCLI